MLTRTFAGLLVATLVLGSGCRTPDAGGPARSPAVATIGGIPVPLSAFQNYLAVHFVDEGLDEPASREDTDRVLSRLFDDFVTESLLVLEADRRGVRVDPAEISAWIGEEPDPDPAREAGRKEQARRELAARRLLEAWMVAEDKAERRDRPPDAGGAAARLAASLRTRDAIKLHTEVLPFRYAPDRPGAR